jgi:hypothetical protein
MQSYEAFNVENAAELFRGAAEEIAKVDGPQHIVVGRIVVCADKIMNLIKRSQKDFEATITPDVREKLRCTLERELGMRIRNTAHLWELLRIASKHMNQIGQVPKQDRVRAQKICSSLSELFPN